MSQRQKTNKKSKKTKQVRSATDGWDVSPNASLRLPPTVSNIISDRLMTRLTYKGVQTVSILSGTSAITRRWQPTACFDVDPVLGSTTVVGFSEMALLYNYYRVLRSRIKVSALSVSQPAQLIVIPLVADPGSSPSLATVDSWVNNTYGKIKLIPTAGGPLTVISHQMTTEKIVGSKMVYFDDNFASLVNTIPNNNWFWAVGIRMPGTAGSTLSYTLESDIEMDVEFYSRKNLLN